MTLALDEYTRNALVGAGIIVVMVLLMVIAIYWPRGK
jgi:hypothetical protein